MELFDRGYRIAAPKISGRAPASQAPWAWPSAPITFPGSTGTKLGTLRKWLSNNTNLTLFCYLNVSPYPTKSCRQQAEVIQNHGKENVRYIGQGEARHRKYKRLKLGGGHVCGRSSV
jgi:hypothetical protein